MEATPRTLSLSGRDRTTPRTWTGKLESGTHQGKDRTAPDVGTCPFLGVLRPRGQTLLDWQISASAVKQPHLCLTSALLPAGAVSPTKGWEASSHRSAAPEPTPPTLSLLSLLSPAISTYQHKGWQGAQLERARRAFYLLGSSQSFPGLLP